MVSNETGTRSQDPSHLRWVLYQLRFCPLFEYQSYQIDSWNHQLASFSRVYLNHYKGLSDNSVIPIPPQLLKPPSHEARLYARIVNRLLNRFTACCRDGSHACFFCGWFHMVRFFKLDFGSVHSDSSVVKKKWLIAMLLQKLLNVETLQWLLFY